MTCAIQEETSVTNARLLEPRDCREKEQEALQNRLLAAAESLPVFESEVAHLGWLTRILIEEV